MRQIGQRHGGENGSFELKIVASRLIDFNQAQRVAIDHINFIKRPLHDRGQPSCLGYVGHILNIFLAD